MPREYKIYYCEKVPDEVSEHVERMLKDVFDIQFRSVGVRIPRQNAWDVNDKAFNAKTLLNNVLRDGITYFLWLIEEPLAVDNKSVFGYAESSKGAVVSTSKMATRTLAAKEVAFQVGIALGLNACREDCVMTFSDNFETLIKKSSTLCNICRIKFDRLKVRYL